MKHLLLALGGSPSSVMASHWAASLGSASDAEVTIAHVLSPDRVIDGNAPPDLTELTSPDLVATFEDAGVAYDARLLVGEPADSILSLAAELNPDMIIMGRRIHTFARPRLLGPLTRQVLKGARRPVVIVPAPAEQLARDQVVPKAVVGIDATAQSKTVLHWAAKFAAALELDLEALTVLDRDGMPFTAIRPPEDNGSRWSQSTYVQGLAAEVGIDPRTRLTTTTKVGVPTEELLRDSELAEILVLGRRQQSGLDRLLDQSTSHFCAARAACPVALAPIG